VHTAGNKDVVPSGVGQGFEIGIDIIDRVTKMNGVLFGFVDEIFVGIGLP
jgi:hypothetical protein